MNGAKIGIFGLARSGLSVARAAKALGAEPTVVDEKPLEQLKSREIYDQALALGAKVILGWTGEFSGGNEHFDFIVTSPGVPATHPKLQGAVKYGVPVYSEVEFAYRIARAPIVAITGTNGKSTTTAMTYSCLRAAGKDAVLCGNIYGSGFDEVPLTEAALQSAEDQILVAEVSSFQLEWVSAFRPIAAAITNITPDHLDRHRSFDEYAAAKHRIWSAQGAHDFAIVNADDPEIIKPSMPEVMTFGKTGREALIADANLILDGKAFRREEFSIYGDHNMLNAAAAALLASSALAEGTRSMFYIRDEVVDALRSFKGIAHRMEVVGEKNGIKIINNSMCTNPAAIVASSQSIPANQHLLVGGSNKKLDFGPVLNYMIRSGNKHRLYLFGRDAKEVNTPLGGENPVFETMADAFQAAIRNANPGEVVMLAPGCASMDQFRDFEDRGNVFKSIAKEWLES